MRCLLYFGIFLLTSTVSLCENDGNEDNKNSKIDKTGVSNIQGTKKLSDVMARGELNSDKDEELKRGWSDMGAWGKRAFHTPTLGKRKWAQMSAWGKRAFHTPMLGKRKWAQMSAWGKRKWMNTWGKRKWSTMSSWGKRSSPKLEQELTKIGDNLVSVHKRDTEHSVPQKRQWNHFVTWGKRSTPMEKKWAMSAWGKRYDDPFNRNPMGKWSYGSVGKGNYDSNELSKDKRKWAMSSWGKREFDSTKDPELEKKWAMGAWGKRGRIYTAPYYTQSDVNFDNSNGDSITKRKWSSFNSWGKRARWNFPIWNKRPWTWTKSRRGWGAMSSWGKRSGYPSTLSNMDTIM